jgi:RNA polymerase sigma factor (sigma-70 family)
MNTSGSVPVQALLEHHDFVRRLARSLVRDDASAEDLAQETWLAALESPPREVQSLRGWLATVMRSRAANERRTLVRRVAREAEVARNAGDESEAHVLERVETSQSLVAAVLALDEPYRSVVLLHHYDGLGAAEIARTRGVPEGTVRSQLSRGHVLLRERLDRGYGERKTWLAALAPLAGAESATKVAAGGLSAKALALASAAVVVALVPFAWHAFRSEPTNSVASAEPTRAQRDGELLAALASPAVPNRVEASPSASAVNAPSLDPVAPVPASVDVSGYSIEELLVLAEHAQKLAYERTLARSDDWPVALQSLAVRDDTGIFWLMPRGRFPFEPYNPFAVRGGGAYYSFLLRTHDYDQLADLELEGEGTFLSGFYGGHFGFVTQLECASLLDVPTRGGQAPEEWSASARSRWTALWLPRGREGSSSYPAFRAALEATGLSRRVTAKAGEVYALRSMHPAESADCLVALQVIDARDGAVRVAWRMLHVFTEPEGRPNVVGPPESVRGPAPAWLAELDARGLLDTLAAIREAAQRKLFAIDPVLDARWARFVAGPDSGIVRVLQRNSYARVVEKREGGSCWSFRTRDHDYDREPNFYLESDRLCPLGSGGLLDCGEMSIEDIVAAGRTAPPTWTSERQEAWAFLWDVQSTPVSERPGERRFEPAVRERAEALGLRSAPVVSAGHSYLLRSVSHGTHDLIAAFEVVEHSETGITIVWRKLADFSDE